MRISTLCAVLLFGALPIVLSFMIPDEATANQVFLGKPKDDIDMNLDGAAKFVEDFEEKFGRKIDRFLDEIRRNAAVYEPKKHTIDTAFEEASKVRETPPIIPATYEYFDTDAWVESSRNSIDSMFQYPPDIFTASHDQTSSAHGDWYPHKPPRNPHGPHPNSTLYDLLGESTHTKILYELIRNDAELSGLLKDDNANLTLFAPTDEAFHKLPHHSHEVPKDVIKKVLMYHMTDGIHQSCDLIYHNTLMSKMEESNLGKRMHQRLRIGLGWHGPAVNFYSKVKVVDVFGKNGVIHGIDAVLIPPPSMLDILEVLPTEFSTTLGALYRTGLMKELPKLMGNGLTLFAPSNEAWKKLGFKLNAFLFSNRGKKYLKAILQYHISPNRTLYSDAYVVPGSDNDPGMKPLNETNDPYRLPHGYQHIDLPTLLKDRNLSVDIFRYARFLSFRVNGLASIGISDGIAKDSVIHVPDHVLVPPHLWEEHPEQETGKLGVQELMDRLSSYVDENSQHEL